MIQLEFEVSNIAKYKIEEILDNEVYAKKLKARYLPEFYYLILQKDYLKEKNT